MAEASSISVDAATQMLPTRGLHLAAPVPTDRALADACHFYFSAPEPGTLASAAFDFALGFATLEEAQELPQRSPLHPCEYSPVTTERASALG